MLASVTSALSQGAGLLQIALLVGGGPSEATDAYIYLFLWAQVAPQIWLLGTLYPLWLRGTVLEGARGALFLTGTAISAIALPILGGLLFSRIHGTYPELLLHILLSAAVSVSTCSAWLFALRLLSKGHASWLAATTLAANGLGALSIAIAFKYDAPTRVSILLATQASGFILMTFVIMKFRGAISRGVYNHRPQTKNTLDGGGWFFSQAAAGYGSIIAVQSQVASLPAGGVTVIGLISRVLGGLTGVITTAIVPQLINSNTDTAKPLYVYLKVVLAVTGTLSAIATVIGLLVPNYQWHSSILAIICAWFAAASLNTCMKRLAAKTLPPRIALFSLSLNVAVPLIVLIFTLSGSLSLGVALMGLILLDLAPGAFLAGRLGKYRLAVLYVVTIVTLTVFNQGGLS